MGTYDIIPMTVTVNKISIGNPLIFVWMSVFFRRECTSSTYSIYYLFQFAGNKDIRQTVGDSSHGGEHIRVSFEINVKTVKVVWAINGPQQSFHLVHASVQHYARK